MRGALVQLAEAAAYGEQYRKWGYDSLPILPQEWQYAVASDKGKQFKILKDLMHRADVSEVVNACDAGREGELIFRFVYDVAGCKKPMRRLWISSMEESAIKAALRPSKTGRVRPPLFLCPLQGKSRLDYRYQYDPPVLLPVWKDAECGARPDPDAQNACRPGRRHYHL